MTHGTLRREIPTLEPDDDFVVRLAALAAASRPSRGGVVVPVAFGGPAGRAMVVATAVAALTAGAAAAAQLGDHSRDVPAPPVTSTGIQRPAPSAPADDRSQHSDHAANGSVTHPRDSQPPSGSGSAAPAHAVVAADPRPPRPHESGDDTSTDEHDGSGNPGPGSTDGTDGTDDSGSGTDDGGSGGGTGSDDGGSGDVTSDGGSRDGGGTSTGSGDGSDGGPGSGDSSVLSGNSD